MIKSKLDSLERINEFISLNKKVPILLAIDDDSIMWKVVESNEDTDEHLIEKFNEEVPNGDSNEFFIDFVNPIMTYTRLSFIQEVIKKLDYPINQLISVFLNPGTNFKLCGENKQEYTSIGNHRFQFNNGALQDIKRIESEDLQFDNEIIEANFVMAFAAAYRYLALETRFLGQNPVHGNESEFAYKLIVDKVRMPLLLSLLTVFLLNSLCFLYLTNVQSNLGERLNTIKLLNQRIESIESFIGANQEVLHNTSNDPYFSVLGDKLAQTIPSNIKLTKMQFSPLIKTRANRGAIGFSPDEIWVEGIAISPNDYSSWIRSLEKSDWINLIEDQEYNENLQKKIGEFTIKMKVNVE